MPVDEAWDALPSLHHAAAPAMPRRSDHGSSGQPAGRDARSRMIAINIISWKDAGCRMRSNGRANEEQP